MILLLVRFLFLLSCCWFWVSFSSVTGLPLRMGSHSISFPLGPLLYSSPCPNICSSPVQALPSDQEVFFSFSFNLKPNSFFSPASPPPKPSSPPLCCSAFPSMPRRRRRPTSSRVLTLPNLKNKFIHCSTMADPPTLSPFKPHFVEPLILNFRRHLVYSISLSLSLSSDCSFFVFFIPIDCSVLASACCCRRFRTWEVKMDGRRLTYGWEEFAVDHDFRIGDIIVFRYEGNMVFHVTGFGSSLCNLQYALSPFEDDEEEEKGNCSTKKNLNTETNSSSAKVCPTHSIDETDLSTRAPPSPPPPTPSLCRPNSPHASAPQFDHLINKFDHRTNIPIIDPERPEGTLWFGIDDELKNTNNHIIQTSMDQLYYSWQVTPEHVRHRWWLSFIRSYRWHKKNTIRVYAAWKYDVQCRMKLMMNNAKRNYIKNGRQPPWANNNIFHQLIQHWTSEDFQSKSSKAKESRYAEKVPGEGLHRHTSGSKSFLKRRKELTQNMGRQPTLVELVAETHTKKKVALGDTYAKDIKPQIIDPRAERTIGEVNGKIKQQSLAMGGGSSSFELTPLEQDKIYLESVRANKGRIYGLGSLQKDIVKDCAAVPPSIEEAFSKERRIEQLEALVSHHQSQIRNLENVILRFKPMHSKNDQTLHED